MTPLYAQEHDYSKYNVLAVDDIPLNLLLVQKMLSRFNFTMRTAANGQQALDAIAEMKPDLILLDLMMAYNSAVSNGRHRPLIPTALPGTSFFLNMPYAPGREMIDRGLPLALASDYNPGSTPSGDMKFVVSLACINMRLTPEEAINAATLNSAAAMDLAGTCGSITQGKKANIIITQPIPSISFIPYAYTSPVVKTVILNGKVVVNC